MLKPGLDPLQRLIRCDPKRALGPALRNTYFLKIRNFLIISRMQIQNYCRENIQGIVHGDVGHKACWETLEFSFNKLKVTHPCGAGCLNILRTRVSGSSTEAEFCAYLVSSLPGPTVLLPWWVVFLPQVVIKEEALLCSSRVILCSPHEKNLSNLELINADYLERQCSSLYPTWQKIKEK